MTTWASKDPDEKFAVEFDFSSKLSSISSASITVETYRGDDSSPSDVLDGSYQVSSASVLQRVKDGEHRAVYRIKCVATDGTEVWVLVAYLPVSRK